MDPEEDISGGKDSGGGGSPWGSASNIAAGTGLVGLGLSIFGMQKKVAAEKAGYAEQMQQAQLEMQVNQQRRLQMNLTSQRESMQNLRKVQQAQAAGLAAGVSKGAQFGSGVQGGQAQAAAQGAGEARNIRRGQ